MATTSTTGISAPDFHDRNEAFGQKLGTRYMAPLWGKIAQMAPPQPAPRTVAHVWPYAEVRPCLMEAGDLISAAEAERRVLILENPAFVGEGRASGTLYAGVQLVLPGETAPAHRHVASALRFVLESSGGYTVVAGERTTMARGDFVITPSWTWHDHGNDSDEPVVWVDILDAHIVNFFETSFFEHYNEATHGPARPEGDALARFGTAMLPIEPEPRFGATSPVFNYPFERTRAALVAIASAGSLDPHWGASLRYANPTDGGWAMPTISTWMTYLPAGTRTAPVRSTDGMVVCVPYGRGRMIVDGQRHPFAAQDVLAAPNWTWRSFEAEEDCFLFCASDRVVQEKLGIWREEKAPA
ncbi:cupin domain-containing protein [Novosphingobium pentaromativorans]|uniref:Gentisate 1,2-dioxygenase n=1 Tax=Novosphingobium pentaromativorans US6-1 TaxID=1088721 RepID=G6EB61_9SPHN|nr:cupin domain-containing protein [Novosphingobium pentaromativorans]AIT80495.1 gentisate 1,2-dioxygenase [Novosphingobium pentaromativorans US6-1]EHJ61528.1 gentisate 1,2-dioxygenase [Novosphingobium pentaromativorans US6-1]